MTADARRFDPRPITLQPCRNAATTAGCTYYAMHCKHDDSIPTKETK